MSKVDGACTDQVDCGCVECIGDQAERLRHRHRIASGDYNGVMDKLGVEWEVLRRNCWHLTPINNGRLWQCHLCGVAGVYSA